MEHFIRDRKRTVRRLWWNHKVNYYNLTHPDEAPTALKVSWVNGIREKQSFIMEVSYAMQVHEYRFAATLKVGETTWISYLVVELPGQMEKDLPQTLQVQEELQRLEKAAISRYETKYDMINLCGSTLFLSYCLYYIRKKLVLLSHFIYLSSLRVLCNDI
jgi:hypothetical protein